MSLSDAKRFADALATDKELAQYVKENATGLASVVEIAKARGYDFSVDEAKSFVQSRVPQELTDEQLEAVAGGKGSSTGTSTVQTQTTVTSTTGVEEVEVATTAVQVSEAAADTAAAAEVVAVAAAAVVLT